MPSRTEFKPGKVDTITRKRRDGSTYIEYRVRWTNPRTGERPSYSGLVDEADGERFQAWLRYKGGCVTRNDTALLDGTWRGDESAGTVTRDQTFGDFARADIDARRVSD